MLASIFRIPYFRELSKKPRVFHQTFFSLSQLSSKIQKKQQISQEQTRDRCEIAASIIQLIENPISRYQFDQNTQKPIIKDSLRDQIVKKIEEYPGHQGKSQLKKLFFEGVNIEENFQQMRTILGQSQSKNVVFYPTYFITSQMFTKIKKSSQYKYVLSGSFGFSKTFSTLLYLHLTNYIASYRLKYPQSALTLAKKTLEHLKVIYRTLQFSKYRQQYQQNDNKINPFRYIQINFSDFLQKLQEIKQQDKYLQVEKHYDQYIRKYQKNDIDTLLVIDQINALVSIKRRASLLLNKQNSNVNQQDKNIKLLKDQKKIADKISMMIRNISTIVRKDIYLSSVNIEKAYLNQLNLTGSVKHTQQDITNQNYLNLANNPSKFIDLLNFYIFWSGELVIINNQKLKNWHKKIDPQSLKLRQEIRNQLIDFASKKIGYLYLTPYSINQSLKDLQYDKNQKHKYQIEKSQYNTLVNNYLSNFIKNQQKCLIKNQKTIQQRQLQQKINKKNNLDYICYLLFIINHNLMLKKIKPQPHIVPEISVKNFPPQLLKNLQNNLANNTEKQLFQYDNTNKTIKLYCCAGFLFKLVQKYQTTCLNYFAVEQYEKILKGLSQDTLECQFQQHLIGFLNLANAIFTIRTKNSEEIFFCKEGKSQILKSIPHNNQRKKLKKYSLIKPLSQIFVKVIQNTLKIYNYSAIVLPPKQNQTRSTIYPQQRQKNHKDIDFMLVKMSDRRKQNLKIIQVWAFDACVSNNEKSINEKIKYFLSDFKEFKQDNTNRMTLTYKNSLNHIFTEEFIIQLKFYVIGCQSFQKGADSNMSLKSFKQVYLDQKKSLLLTQVGSISIYDLQCNEIHVDKQLLKNNDVQRTISHFKSIKAKIMNQQANKQQIKPFQFYDKKFFFIIFFNKINNLEIINFRFFIKYKKYVQICVYHFIGQGCLNLLLRQWPKQSICDIYRRQYLKRYCFRRKRRLQLQRWQRNIRVHLF